MKKSVNYILFIGMLILISFSSAYPSEKDNSQMSFKIIGQVYEYVKVEFYGKFDRAKFLSAGLDGAANFIRGKGKNPDHIPVFKASGDETTDVTNFENHLTKAMSFYEKQGINNKDIMRAALDNMLLSLNDPYTLYMDPSQYKQFNETMGASDYSGIGIFIELDVKNKNRLIILEPVEGAPAYKAGLRSGDQILEINGLSTKGMDADKASKLIKGKEGSIVVIKITRERASHPIEFEIVRSPIHMPSVTGKIINDNIGLLKITVFGETTGEEFQQKLDELTSRGVKGLIIDLRNNGGGFVKAAVAICSHFISKGDVIVTIKEKSKEDVETSLGYTKVKLPVIVLINRYSASASEITSGALQDYGVARLVGDKSFGKGCVQSITDLDKSGGAALKMTIANYFTPKGRAIHHIGLEPDYKLPMGEQYAGKQKNDTQLQKALELLR